MNGKTPDPTEIANSALDKYVNKSKVNDIISILKPDEKVNYLLKSPMSGFSREDSPEIPGSMLSKAQQWGDSTLYITQKRLLFTRVNNGKIRADHVPYQNISEVDISTGGWISTGHIKIKTDNHQISASPHKHINDERADSITSYIRSESRHSPPWVSESVGDIEGVSSVWGSVTVETEILENYGVGLSQKKYDCTISPQSITFKSEPTLTQESETVTIDTANVDFNEIKTASRRDFKQENKGRYINILNPALESDSPAKKSNMDTIKIPIINSNDYVIFTPNKKGGKSAALDAISLAESYAHDATQSQDGPAQTRQNDTDSAMEVLKKRLAEGEISVEEFERRKDALE